MKVAWIAGYDARWSSGPRVSPYGLGDARRYPWLEGYDAADEKLAAAYTPNADYWAARAAARKGD